MPTASQVRPSPRALGWPKGQAGVGDRGAPPQRASPALASEEASEVRGDGEGSELLCPRAPWAPWPGGLLHDPGGQLPSQAACPTPGPHVTQKLHERHSRVCLDQERLWAPREVTPFCCLDSLSQIQRQIHPKRRRHQ